MKKITICEVATINNEEQIVDQQDYNIPFMHYTELALLCEYSDCDKDCKNCIIEKLIRIKETN